MIFENTHLFGVVIITPQLFRDERGSFSEIFRMDEFAKNGIPRTFAQENCSLSQKGVLRGLHFQDPPQGKLVWVAHGEAFDVAVDIRPGSPTFGKHVSLILSGRDRRMLYIPEGFAHGFLALSEDTVFCYKCTAYYAPMAQRGIRWDDPALSIEWPSYPRYLSEKDASLPTLRELFG
ncbi:MAG: dTDP-4-dehydrorhamnose 3,5-epimerase [Christensenellales bacterium]|jgi:dTDP-4-dehydrorhamnose 3,5-epimerase